MGSKIYHAIQVDFQDPSLSASQYGIIDGVGRYITSVPGYDGLAPFPTIEGGGDETNVWFEDMLIENSISPASKRVDITDSGAYATLSTFRFELDNTADMVSWLEDQGVFVKNLPVQFFVVVDDVFYPRWQGIVDSDPNDELGYKFSCIDSFKNVHKTTPIELISSQRFPGYDITSSSEGDFVPITLGNHPDAKPFPIETKAKPDEHLGVYDKVTSIGGLRGLRSYFPISNSGTSDGGPGSLSHIPAGRGVLIIEMGLIPRDDMNLVGKYVRVSRGEGIGEFQRIISHRRTDAQDFNNDIWSSKYIDPNTGTVTSYRVENKNDFGAPLGYFETIELEFPFSDEVIDERDLYYLQKPTPGGPTFDNWRFTNFVGDEPGSPKPLSYIEITNYEAFYVISQKSYF